MYRHLYGLQRARSLEKRLSESSTAQQDTELEAKVLYDYFDSNIELIDGFQNLKNMEFEFTNQEKYVSAIGH